MPFAENLFHFKLDQPKHSIAPGEYGRLPLFDVESTTTSVTRRY